MVSLTLRCPRVRAFLIISLTGIVAISIGTLYSVGSADLSGQDQQPIAFSHVRHAGNLNIHCLYCHRAAAASPVAGVPSMNTCVSCHRNVANETPETRKLMAAWENGEPVEWVRLHRLPDFVYFTHERHLRAGLQCVKCHGHVDKMASTPRAASLEMGWCISCHEARGASRDCWTCHK